MELVATESEGAKPHAEVGGKPRRERDHLRAGFIVIKQVFACLTMVSLAFGCYQLSQRFVFETVQVSGVSMLPTLHDSNLYLLNRLIYHFREPRAGEIVVLRDPEDKSYAIKRIVARPGDSVYVKEGKIFVNGKRLNEPYLPKETRTFASEKYSAQFWICGARQYFVLGDNRNNSTDSRIYGAVPKQNILGLVSP